MDKPTATAQLADSAVLGGIAVARVAKNVRGDVLGLLAQLCDQLTAKLSSDAVMTVDLPIFPATMPKVPIIMVLRYLRVDRLCDRNFDTQRSRRSQRLIRIG